MELECCWKTEIIESAQCPNIMDDERELRFSLKRRLLEKCLECPRFGNDLEILARTEPSLSMVLRHLAAEYLDQKEQIHYMAGFLNSRNRELQFLHEIGTSRNSHTWKRRLQYMDAFYRQMNTFYASFERTWMHRKRTLKR